MLRPGQLPILIVNVLALLGFTAFFLFQKNYEFMLYIVVIILLGGLILYSTKWVQYPNGVLWLLTAWAIGHMAGGSLPVGDGVLYTWILVDLVGEPYNILKYDQVIHMYGFFVAALVMYVVLKPHLKPKGWAAIGLVVIMASLGLGAMNEIVEFIATIISPDNGVGGYHNTALDLVADLLGAVLGWIYIKCSGM
ncbi:MAG: DUF2238 domain-containing protein [Candidatus Woesearchaeota archaeon]|nr:DUF2238 domain-containing protein [Candidatus Woesearchaeota archaeon]